MTHDEPPLPPKKLPLWGTDRLDLDRLAAAERFREELMKIPLDQYLRAFQTHADNISRLLAKTADLHQLRERAAEIVTDHELLVVLSALVGPPIAVRDLQTLARAPRLSPATVDADPALATRVVETVLEGLDSQRFPWIRDDRKPTAEEKRGAIQSSSAVLATLEVRTTRHAERRSQQEENVHHALLALGLRDVPTRAVATTADSPRPGEFYRESVVAGRRADFLIGLWDERLLALECRISSSPLDSARRLRHEAQTKAARWTRTYGSQIVVAVVLSGIYALRDLLAVQHDSIGLFWTHDIGALTDWIDQTRVQ